MQRLVRNIFDFKTELMGFAILILMVFHSPGIPSFIGLKYLLDLGVDIFLLLGGFTCTYSYVRLCNLGGAHNTIRFYRKRFWRILPPFLILYTFVYGYQYLIVGDGDWIEFLGQITMYDNLVHNSVIMWYVPALLLMYLLIPFYVNCFQICKGILWTPIVVFLIIVGLILSGYLSDIPFYMAWLRLPVFLLGIDIYLLKDVKININSRILLIVCLLSIAGGVYFHSQPSLKPLQQLCYIPIVLSVIYFYDNNKFLKQMFAFIGSFTLENYLIHWWCVLLCYNISAPLVNAIISIEVFSPLTHHTLGLEALMASLLSYPIAIYLAYKYHILLEKIIYN